MNEADVIILGAGPVGLMLANLLGDQGVSVLILERRTTLPATSQAIGVTPPSLHLFARLGLDQSLIAQGVKIRDCHVHGETGYLGCASFREIARPYRFILSLPQRLHMQALETRLERLPQVTLKRGEEVVTIQEHPSGRVSCLTKSAEYQAAYVVGCDGHASQLRKQMQVPTRRKDYGCHFVMGDFTDHSALGEDAHLWFTASGAVESFPLPEGLRRWIVQVPESGEALAAGTISQRVRERTGYELPASHQINQSAFSPWRLDCDRYFRGRMILCGDAAHVMSPIGGQGMNTGWADAEFLAEALAGILAGRYDAQKVLAAYGHYRRRSAMAAATRAAQGMGLGTWTGKGRSLMRDFLMSQCLFKGPLRHQLGPHFAMQTLPYHSLAAVPERVWKECAL